MAGVARATVAKFACSDVDVPCCRPGCGFEEDGRVGVLQLGAASSDGSHDPVGDRGEIQERPGVLWEAEVVPRWRDGNGGKEVEF